MAIKEIGAALDRVARNTINDNFKSQDGRIDNLVLQAGDAHPELQDAHYSGVKFQTFDTIGKRFDAAEQQAITDKVTANSDLQAGLATKRDKSVMLTQADMSTASEAHKITPNHLNQAVKDMMTGTTPVSPNIADGQVTTQKIADKAITYSKMSEAVFGAVSFEFSATTTSFSNTKYASLMLDKNTLCQVGKFSCKLYTNETLSSLRVVIFSTPLGVADEIGTQVEFTPTITAVEGGFEVSGNYSINAATFETQNFNLMITSFYGTQKNIRFTIDEIVFNGNLLRGEYVIDYKVFHKPNPLLPTDTLATVASRKKFVTDYELEKTFETLVAKKTLSKIAFLGDSITFGVGTSAVEKRYSTLVANNYSAFEQNLGISSTRFTEQIDGDDCLANRVGQISADADIAVIFGGTNDYWHNMPIGTFGSNDKKTFYGAVNYTLGTMRKSRGAVEVVLVIPYRQFFSAKGSETPNTQGNKLSDYVKALRDVAQLYSLTILDLFNESSFDVEHYSEQRDLFVPDGVHPNDLGAQRIARRLIKKIDSVL